VGVGFVKEVGVIIEVEGEFRVVRNCRLVAVVQCHVSEVCVCVCLYRELCPVGGEMLGEHEGDIGGAVVVGLQRDVVERDYIRECWDVFHVGDATGYHVKGAAIIEMYRNNAARAVDVDMRVVPIRTGHQPKLKT